MYLYVLEQTWTFTQIIFTPILRSLKKAFIVNEAEKQNIWERYFITKCLSFMPSSETC